MVDIPLPTVEMIAVAILFYLAGAVTPWYYAQERLRGFGRAVTNKLPYAPPPGENADSAMRRAVAAGLSTEEAAEEAEEPDG